MSRRSDWLFVFAMVAFSASAFAQAPPPVGDDFLISETSNLHVIWPDVASSAGGGFSVVWQALGLMPGGLSYNGILGRRFTSLGSPLGGDFQINTTTDGNQTRVDIGMNPGGASVVAWTRSATPSESRIRRYDAFGNPLGDDVTIAVDTESNAVDVVVDIADSGSFAVAWLQGVTGGDGGEILLRRYSGTGVPLGDPVLANTYTTGNQFGPAIAFAPSGAFVVAWVSDGSPGNDNDGRSVQGRCFAADGAAIGSQFQVNTTTLDDQAWPNVGVADSGAFVVTWESDSSSGSDNDNSSVQARRFTADCTPVGTDFQVNTFFHDWQGEPVVGVSPNGAFTVVWSSDGSPETDHDRNSIHARSYTADGIALSDQYQVNSTEVESQTSPAIAGDPSSRFVIVWGHDSSGFGSIRGRLFGFGIVFLNGFETGNTLPWSFTTP